MSSLPNNFWFLCFLALSLIFIIFLVYRYYDTLASRSLKFYKSFLSIISCYAIAFKNKVLELSSRYFFIRWLVYLVGAYITFEMACCVFVALCARKVWRFLVWLWRKFKDRD